MWFVLLSDGGVMQQGYHLFGLNYQSWLVTNPMLAVSLANAWRGAAFSFLLFSAALDGIPTDLIDAAEVDGAGGWRRLTRLTIPLLSSAIVVDLVIITLATLNDFSLIYAMTGGARKRVQRPLGLHVPPGVLQLRARLRHGHRRGAARDRGHPGGVYIRLLRRQGSLAEMR